MDENNIRPSEDELIAQEEKCRKAMKTVAKAVFMRIFVTALLIWVLFRTAMELWIIGMILLVLLINLSGLLPLVAEWRKQRRKLKEILEQYE